MAAAGPGLVQSVPALAALTATQQLSGPAAQQSQLPSAGQLSGQIPGHLLKPEPPDATGQHTHLPHPLSGPATVQTGQTSDQQTHFMPLSASGASDFAPHGLLATSLLHLPSHMQLSHSPVPDPSGAAPSSELSPTPLSRQIAPVSTNPFASISQHGLGEESSPGLLLNTDLQAAAAAWDDRQQCGLSGADPVLGELPTSLPLSSPYSLPMTGMPTSLPQEWTLASKDVPHSSRT